MSSDEEFEKKRKRQRTEKQEKTDKMEIDTPSQKKETLHPSVREFVSTIFDLNMMTKQLESLDFDVKKMPLGKIKKKQLKDAYKILTEVQDILEAAALEKKDPSPAKLQDCTNRFYTLLPHNFGRKEPELIVSEKRQVAESFIG